MDSHEKTVRMLFRKLAQILHGFFSPFFRPQSPRHPKSPNPRQSWNSISQRFRWLPDPGMHHCFLDASTSMPINQDLSANHFCSKNFWRHNPESIDSVTWIFQSKSPRQIPSVLAQFYQSQKRQNRFLATETGTVPVC